MAQSFPSAEEVPLFACTKCNSRHSFEDLSQGHQLCKDCRSSVQVVKCNYCRSEFHQDIGSSNGGKGSSICKKCEQLQEQHGKPGPCAYCNIIAAFIGTNCQRCTNSEKKYGPPMACEHCRQKCAFDRKDPESKKKVDGKLLCWLCTMAYKRTLAKARQKEALLKSSSSSFGTSVSGAGGTHHSGHRHSSHRHSTHSHSSSSHRHRDSGSSSSNSANKKQRLDNLLGPPNGHHLSSNSSNGHLSSSIPSLSDGRSNDPNSSDLAAVVTQLKDQVASLNKRLQMKEKDLLSKDQQIADLKSTNAREQRELREKITSLQKQHSERISDMQAKLVTLQRQISSQTKATKATPTTYVEPPLAI